MDEGFAVFGETLQVTLKLINQTLRLHVIHLNLNMIYALLCGESEVVKWMESPLISESGWLGEIPMLLKHFRSKLDGKDTSTAEKTMAIVSNGVKSLPGYADSQLPGFTPPHENPKMVYEEGQDPEYFFVPYVWQVSQHITRKCIRWNEDSIQLFQPSHQNSSSM